MIDTSSGFPHAQTPDNIPFSTIAETVAPGLAIAAQERSIWQLCSILFDPLDEACAHYMNGVPEEKVEEFGPRMRMDALGTFWSQLVAPLVQDGLKRARTPEEKALLHLTQNDIVAACGVLVGAKDFRLATLISQLPGTEANRSMMRKQISAWRNRHDWSEMSEPVRALYSILAGEVCVVEGKSGAAENRVAEFCITEKFGLGWLQSFALRLYFGGYQTIERTIEAYSSDLESKRERLAAKGVAINGEETEDTIMKLLRLFAGTPNSTVLFDPIAVAGSSINSRLTWQLASLLNARGHCSVSNEQLDQISYNFATELELAGIINIAAWILLHVHEDRARQKAIVGLLERNGDKIQTPGQEEFRGTFEELTGDLHIPAPLVWRGNALYAKAGLQDPALQTQWLLRAGDVEDAHEVLCTTLGPRAVIEQDLQMLDDVLHAFPRRVPEGWQRGGQVYVDFLRVVHAHAQHKRARDVQASLQRLGRGLAAMNEDGGRNKSLEERVAIIEMDRVLAETLREHGDADRDQEMGGLESSGPASDMLSRYQQAMGMVA